MKLLEITKYDIYLDIDGVFADFAGYIKKLSGKSPEDFESKNKLWKILGDDVEAGNKPFSNFKKLSDADKLFNYVKKYNPVFLSATGKSMAEEIGKQKCEWIQKYYPNSRLILVNDATDKAKYVSNSHSILIDDRTKSIDPWIAAGGIGILHITAEDTINKLKKLGL